MTSMGCFLAAMENRVGTLVPRRVGGSGNILKKPTALNMCSPWVLLQDGCSS